MKINDLLKDIKTLAITGHVKPDGDCIGSTLGLYNYVVKNYPEIDADIYLDSPPDKFAFLGNFDKIDTRYEKDKAYDLMICLDAATLERIGNAGKYFETAGHTVNIDHHISNTVYADENHVEAEASSASEVLYEMLEPEMIGYDTALCLYTGIIFDTGVFKYPLTSPHTMRVAADLMGFGIPTNEIIDGIFYEKGYNENRIMGYALLNSMLAFGGRVIWSYISMEDMENFHVDSSEVDGIVPQLRLTKGVVCALFMYETAPGEYKGSLRSTEEFDVDGIAVKFGGGGHKRAAGFNIKGEPGECIDKVLKEIGDNLPEA